MNATIYELRLKLGTMFFTEIFATITAAQERAEKLRSGCVLNSLNFGGIITPLTAVASGEFKPNTERQLICESYKVN